MINLANQNVLVTGVSKLLGVKVVQVLKSRQANVHYVTRSQCNLVDADQCDDLFRQVQPRYVVHLATNSGNVQWNTKYPATTFFSTSLMNLNVLWACYNAGVQKVISVMSSCAIADKGNSVLTEDDLWNGLPNQTVESHGLAKRQLDVGSRFLRQQYGINAVTCILQNLIGEGDSCDLSKTKVVMSLIKKYVDATKNNDPSVTNWGTGQAKREFVYAWDAAECIVQLLEGYNDSEPINIASDNEISIKDLAELIAELVGYKGVTKWDTTKSDGQLRKKLSTEKMWQYVDIEFTPIKDALTKTIIWYRTYNER